MGQPPAIIDRRLSIIDQLDDEDKFIVAYYFSRNDCYSTNKWNTSIIQTAGVGSMRPVNYAIKSR